MLRPYCFTGLTLQPCRRLNQDPQPVEDQT